jgi:hypothetical protein
MTVEISTSDTERPANLVRMGASWPVYLNRPSQVLP